MEKTRLFKIYSIILCVIAALIVVHAPMTVLLQSFFPEYTLAIKSWKELLLVLAVPLGAGVVYQYRLWRELRRDKLVWLVFGLVAVHLISLIFSNDAITAAAGLAIDLRYLVYFSLVYVLVCAVPETLGTVKRIMVAGAILVLSFGLIQLVLPRDALSVIGYSSSTITPYTTIDQNDSFTRYQSTLRGPNPYGAYAMSVVIIAAALLSRAIRRDYWWQLAFITAGTIGVYMSYARSAALGLIIGIAIVITIKWRNSLQIRHWLGIGLLLAGVTIGALALRNTDFVSNVILHEDPGESNNINSNEGHLRSVTESVERMVNEPLGRGVGSTGSASLLGEEPLVIENQYLLIAHEVGWMGLALFAAVFGVVLRRLWLLRNSSWALGIFASGIALAIVGILLPVWADDTIGLLWWGIAGAIIGEGYGKKRTRQ